MKMGAGNKDTGIPPAEGPVDVEDSIQPADTTNSRNDDSEAVSSQPTSRRFKPLVITLLGVSVLLAVIIVVVFVTKKENPNNTTSNTASDSGEQSVRGSLPTSYPSVAPSAEPSATRSEAPSLTPSDSPSQTPSLRPTVSYFPTIAPSSLPSDAPSLTPTESPSDSPSSRPTGSPSSNPSMLPSATPSSSPTVSFMPTISAVPSFAPSLKPSTAPTNVPSSVPSIQPTNSPTTTPSSLPSSIPTLSPSTSPSFSSAPSSGLATLLEDVTPLSVLLNSSTPQNAALQWLNNYDDPSDVDGLIQRYALFVMDFSLSRNSPRVTSRFSSDCSWYGITCDGNGTVTALRWNNLNFNGEIPAEVSALTSLKTLDLGENQIGGTIPSSLYTMSGLEEVFLHQNRLTGEVDGVGFNSMYGLVKLYLNQNQLTGNPLRSIKSVNGGQIRPLRWLNLGFNNFSGSLPDQNVFLHMIYVLDISNNNFWGPVPSNYARSFNRLRAIFLSSNRFNGTLPISLFGNGMAHLVDASENEFSGPLIESSVVDSYEIVRLHGNSFSSIDFRICSEGVFNNGEMIHFSADCNVCRCQPFCSNIC